MISRNGKNSRHLSLGGNTSGGAAAQATMTVVVLVGWGFQWKVATTTQRKRSTIHCIIIIIIWRAVLALVLSSCVRNEKNVDHIRGSMDFSICVRTHVCTICSRFGQDENGRRTRSIYGVFQFICDVKLSLLGYRNAPYFSVSEGIKAQWEPTIFIECACREFRPFPIQWFFLFEFWRSTPSTVIRYWIPFSATGLLLT